MLVVQNVTKKYLGKTAVNGVSLAIEKGRIYAILGPNGSGKTTLMKMIAGLTEPTEGMIAYNDVLVGTETKKHIAYMSTEPFFYNYMSIKDVGKYYQDFFDDFSIDRYYELLNRMQLNPSDKASKLSSGMAAKLKIAATLARRAELYMLDEPLNGIDIIARDHIMQTIIETMHPETSILMSSHLVDEMEKIIDHAFFLKDGYLVLNNSANELRKTYQKSIVDLYRDVYAY